MNFDQFEFIGLSSLLSNLVEYRSEIGYVTVCEYRSRRQLYRMELENEALSDWLASQLSYDQRPHITDWNSMLGGLELWFKVVMSSGMASSQRREYHIQAVAPKGGARPVSGKVVVRGLGCEDEPEFQPASQSSPKLPMPRPDLSEADSTEISKNYRNVGEQYAAVANLVLGSSHELATMYKDQIADLREANAQLRTENSELRQENRNQVRRLEEMVQSQRDQTQASHDQVIELARLQVANNAVGQVTNTVQSFLAMKAGAGLPAPLQALLGAMSQNPALMAAIQEPDVQALLQDQQILTTLAAQLREFASMKKLAAQSSQTPQTTQS